MNKRQHNSGFQVALVYIVLVAVLVAGVNYQTAFGRNAASSYACNGSLMTEAELASYRDISLEKAQRLNSYGLVRFSELCGISQTSLDNAVTALHTIGNPDDFRLAQLQDENGEISAETYLAAQEAHEALLAEGELSAATAGIEQGSWNWIGPGNIGGRVRALAIHPSDSDIMWAGGIAGGIWKTIDGGASWQMQDDFLTSMAITSIVVNPANPDVLYAGTGEGEKIGGGNTVSRWIYKTTDGGATWTQLARTGAPATDTEYVHRLAISPNGDTLLAATEDGILRCSEANSDNYCEDVTDWTLVYETGIPTSIYQVTDIDFRTTPLDTQVVVASGENGLVIRSTDVKAGTPAWTEVTLESGEGVGMGRAEVAYAAGSTVYVSAAVVDYDPSLNGAHIYKSEDDGATFTRQSPAGREYFADGSGNEANLLWVDPADATKIIVGGGNLYRSTNSGVDIAQISDGTQAPNSAFSGQHIAVAGSGDQVIFGTDGGVYCASDIDTVTTTSGWTALNNNLGITSFYSVALTAGGDIVGGTRGTGTIRYEAGAGIQAWTTEVDGEAGFVAADPGDDNIIYGSLPYLKIYRDNNGTFADISGAIGGFEHANYVAPFVLDPHNTNQILAGGEKLWRADNVDADDPPTWTEIKSDIGSNITAIAVGSSSDDVWVGYENGHVYKDINTRVDQNGLSDRQVTRIVVDGSTVYVMFGGFVADNIWKTTTDGTSWSALGNLPLPMPVYDLVADGSNLYIGTEFGVFVSDDAGANWSATYAAGDSPTSSPVQDLLLDGTTLIAATYGRGVFTAEIGSVQPDNDDFDSAMDLSQDISDAINGENGKSMPYTVEYAGGATTLDTTNATTAGDDPAAPACNLAPGTATVWYQYNPGGADTALVFDTLGSDYDTYIAVWKGDRGNLELVACNNDIDGSSNLSKLALQFSGNETYYIQVGQYNGN